MYVYIYIYIYTTYIHTDKAARSTGRAPSRSLDAGKGVPRNGGHRKRTKHIVWSNPRLAQVSPLDS